MKKILTILLVFFFTFSVFSQSSKKELTIKADDILGEVTITPQGLYKYKVTYINTGSIDMFNAIKNNDIQLVKDLITDGYDVTLPIIIEPLKDYRSVLQGTIASFAANATEMDVSGNFGRVIVRNDNEGYIISSVKPTPPFKITALEFAKSMYFTELVSILSSEFINMTEKKLLKIREDSIRIERIKPIKFKIDSLCEVGYKINEGKGFYTFELKKTTAKDIIEELGPCCLFSNNRIICNDLGIAFKLSNSDTESTIEEIAFSGKILFKGSTSKGINLSSTYGDIVKAYGKPIKWEKENCIAYYNGVKFSYYSPFGEIKRTLKKVLKWEINKITITDKDFTQY
jgi:hypothetical protein